MQIRREQMDVFQAIARKNFVTRAREYLRAKYPEEHRRRGEAGMRALVEETMERVKPYGLDTEAGIVLCAELSIKYGEDFYEREPWAQYILTHKELESVEKTDGLAEYLGEQAG